MGLSKGPFPLSSLWLGLIFALEIVLIIPLDAVLMLFCLQKSEKRFLYATIATLGSAVSSICGYLLGWLLWDAIGSFVIKHLISPDFFNNLTQHYAHNEKLAVLFGALLPLPLKAVSLSAGFCQIPFLPFLACILVARGIRFFLVAGAVHKWGGKISLFIDKHFSRLVVAIGAKVALTVLFFFLLSR